MKEYDVIIGYRADDSYFSFAKDFIKVLNFLIIVSYFFISFSKSRQ